MCVSFQGLGRRLGRNQVARLRADPDPRADEIEYSAEHRALAAARTHDGLTNGVGENHSEGSGSDVPAKKVGPLLVRWPAASWFLRRMSFAKVYLLITVDTDYY